MAGLAGSRGAALAAVLSAALAPIAHAQETPGPEAPARVSALDIPFSPVRDRPLPVLADSLPSVDVEARFAAFQADFEREFGRRRSGQRPPEEEFALRMRARLEKRFADSRMIHWYRRAEGLYQRFERVYERVEASTKWAGKGFEVNTHMESVVDGRMRVEVEREIRGFRVAFDVRDASEGRFGARLGGAVRGYRISVDVSDLAAGTFRLQIDKRFE